LKLAKVIVKSGLREVLAVEGILTTRKFSKAVRTLAERTILPAIDWAKLYFEKVNNTLGLEIYAGKYYLNPFESDLQK
jgi:hypothetical protein